jgi:hypothetical protein
MNFFDRLSDYDLFAYLPPGLFVLAAIDYLFGTRIVLDADLDLTKGVLLIFVAYVAGHLAAGPASAILERGVVARFLNRPAVNLLTNEEPNWFLRHIFADYYAPLSEPLRSAVLLKLNINLITRTESERIFWSAYPLAKKDEYARGRMATFLNLYGFCRNISFIAGTTSIIVILQTLWLIFLEHCQVERPRVWVAVGLAAVAFAMFQRYLKFFRLYTVEVFSAAVR